VSLSLDAIGVVCADIDESIRFYRLLGLEFPKKRKAGDDHVEAKTAGGIRVMLDTEALIKSFTPKWTKPKGQRIGLAFACKDAKGVDKTYAKILKEGFKGAKEPWDAFWGQRYAQVLDPDGNKVDLFAPL
jgi:catechol 2,3-dioxygenase-like lactoylglutathione lyase family enzyme